VVKKIDSYQFTNRFKKEYKKLPKECRLPEKIGSSRENIFRIG
jgi:hypothetical protein